MTAPTREHPTLGWLYDCCATESWRKQIAAPFTYDWNGEPWTVATSGWLLVAIRGEVGFDVVPGAGNVAHAVSTAGDGPCVSIDLAALRAVALPPAEPVKCTACDGAGRRECSKCSGDAEYECECECGHLHNARCDVCDGRGWNSCDCSAGIRTLIDRRPINIGVGRFDLNLFARCLPHIDVDVGQWRQAGPEKAARIDAGDWLILVMPLKQNNDSATELRFPLGAAVLSVTTEGQQP